MGVEAWTEGYIKCSKCNKKFHNLKIVLDDYLCEECYEELGGLDYKEALEELNGKKSDKI